MYSHHHVSVCCSGPTFPLIFAPLTRNHRVEGTFRDGHCLSERAKFFMSLNKILRMNEIVQRKNSFKLNKGLFIELKKAIVFFKT